MATLTPMIVSRAGVAFALSATAGGGDAFPNTGKEVLHITNTHATDPCTLSIAVQKKVDGQSAADKTYTVPALTGHLMIGPFPIDEYNDGSGLVQLTYSGGTTKVGAVQTPAP